MAHIARILALVFLLALPIVASAYTPHGNLSRSYDALIATRVDFKDGTGIHDPEEYRNPCTFLLLGVQALIPPPDINTEGTVLLQPDDGHVFVDYGTALPQDEYYKTGRVTTNFNNNPAAVSDLGFRRDGIDTGIPCPLPGSPSTTLHTKWSGTNADQFHALSSEMLLCTRLALAIGCAAHPDTLYVNATACRWDHAVFTAAGDQKGTFLGLLGSRGITCDAKRDGIVGDFDHHRTDGFGNVINPSGTSHIYSQYVTSFEINRVAMGFDKIRNEDLVHYGDGSSYAIVCWDVEYFVLDYYPQGGQSIGPYKARVHDWALVLDVGSFDDWRDALLVHQGGLQLGLWGWYDSSGDNGSPCPPGTDGHDVKLTPII